MKLFGTLKCFPQLISPRSYLVPGKNVLGIWPPQQMSLESFNWGRQITNTEAKGRGVRYWEVKEMSSRKGQVKEAGSMWVFTLKCASTMQKVPPFPRRAAEGRDQLSRRF